MFGRESGQAYHIQETGQAYHIARYIVIPTKAEIHRTRNSARIRTGISYCLLHRHPRENGDPSDSQYCMDLHFREGDDVARVSGKFVSQNGTSILSGIFFLEISILFIQNPRIEWSNVIKDLG